MIKNIQKKYWVAWAILFLFSFQRSYCIKQHDEDGKRNRENLGRNILTVSPIADFFSSAALNSETMIGFRYERILKNEHISYRIPFHLSLKNPYLYLIPSFNVYPTKQGKIKFGIGIQFPIGIGSGTYEFSRFDNANNWYLTLITAKRQQVGCLLNPNINFTIAKHYFISYDLGLGMLYYDRLRQYIDPREGRFNAFLSGAIYNNISFGYRW